MSPVSKEGRWLAVAGLVVVAIAVTLSLQPKRGAPAPAVSAGSQKAAVPKRVAQPGTVQSGVAGADSPGARSWRDVERGLPDLRRKDLDWFLKRARIGDFESELGRAGAVSEAVDWIEGCHEGAVRLSDGRQWAMTTEIAIMQGNTNVLLSEAGATFLNSIGSDGVRDLKKPDGGSAALLLEASENIYFQLYPVRDAGLVAGNLYLRSGDGRIGFGGTVLLRKKDCPHG